MEIPKVSSVCVYIFAASAKLPLEPFYKDFFDPPPRVPSSKPKPSQLQERPTGKVRFHEEVRVKKIKAKGKGLPVSMMYEEDEDDEDGDGDDQYGEDIEEDREDDEDSALDNEEDESEIVGSDGDMQGLDGDDDDDDGFNMDSVERLKDDLFAEDEQAEGGM